ncbi:MAG: hypothetical protein IK093_15410 [Ruminiclostridium sp.]|nr:hypothetical protein [Ruminiclostridium sp.]
MKIPDMSEVTGTGKTSQKPKNVDLGKFRKKKMQSKHLLRLIVILLAVIAFALVWVNADKIFEPLRGIASKVETKTSYDVGFPIELPGSGDYSLRKFGETFSLLTDTYLFAYDTDGAQLYALKHGYSNPKQTTNERRVLLYDKAAYNFALYSKSSLIYQKTVDDKIVYASIGDDGLAAIVTGSSRYSGILYVYDDGGNWKYTRKFADENIMQVCSTGDGEHIVVSTLSARHGDIIANYYRFSIKKSDGYDWKYTTETSSLPCGLYADRSTVIGVCDNTVVAINCDTGDELGEYGYTGELRHFYISPERTVLQYNDISATRNVLLVLSRYAAPMATVNVTASTSCVCCDKDWIYVLDGAKIKTFDEDLINEAITPVTDDDFTEFVKIGDSAIMIGYETLNKTDIQYPSVAA